MFSGVQDFKKNEKEKKKDDTGLYNFSGELFDFQLNISVRFFFFF